jgi:hypothetical protein
MTQTRTLQLTGLFMLLTAVTIIILSAGGFFDPYQAGKLIYTSEPIELVVPAGEHETIWLTELSPANFSVRTAVALKNGEPDSGAGLILKGSCGQLLIAVSGNGRVTIQQLDPENCSPNPGLPWQPWPHLNMGTAPNELWLDVTNKQITVRINREVLWQAQSEFGWRPADGS